MLGDRTSAVTAAAHTFEAVNQAYRTALRRFASLHPVAEYLVHAVNLVVQIFWELVPYYSDLVLDLAVVKQLHDSGLDRLAALSASDLPAAAAEHGRVRAALELLLELPPAEQARHLSQMARLVQEANQGRCE